MKSHPKYENHYDLIYEKWIRSIPCIVCGSPESECHHVWHSGRKSKQLRNSYTSVPLCAYHHRYGADAYHIVEHIKFQEIHNIDLSTRIISLLSTYLDERQGEELITP